MALRKMLGSADHPTVIRLMRLIETQSKTTLTRFAADYASTHYLPILAELIPHENRPFTALQAVQEHLAGAKLPLLKAALKEVRTAAQEQTDPICQAAARAIATACSVAVTPTGALGFTFYGAAAYAYHTVGVSADRAIHDELATQELERIYSALEAASVSDEPNPVKVDWGC